MQQLPLPMKLYYIGPMFRRERPQKGRYRQFYQIGAEVLGGSDAPAIDAEVIEMVMTFFDRLQLPGVQLEINSIGHNADNCRRGYVAQLKAALEKVKDRLGADSQRRIESNPLRVLDSKLEHEQPIIETLPRMGPKSFAIQAIPAGIATNDADKLLTEILDGIERENAAISSETLQAKIAASTAWLGSTDTKRQLKVEGLKSKETHASGPGPGPGPAFGNRYEPEPIHKFLKRSKNGLDRNAAWVYFAITSETICFGVAELLSVESDDLLPSTQSDPMKHLGWSGEVVCFFARLCRLSN